MDSAPVLASYFRDWREHRLAVAADLKALLDDGCGGGGRCHLEREDCGFGHRQHEFATDVAQQT
jgi:hypothetical protein